MVLFEYCEDLKKEKEFNMIKFDVGISQRSHCCFDGDDLFHITLHKNFELSVSFYCCTSCMTTYGEYGIWPRRVTNQEYKLITNFYLECFKHLNKLKENMI